MAQRFGGKYSPKSGTDAGQIRPKGLWRTTLLYVAALPLAVRAFAGGADGLITNLVALALLILAAWLTREGLIAETEYNSRKVARRPALPRKIIGSILMGVGLLMAGSYASGLGAGLIYGIVGAALHSFAFGLDPLQNKGLEGVDQFQADRVARVVEEAEAHLKAMQDAIARVEDRRLKERVEQFSITAQSLFRTVEEDPRDLTASRKYLGVYLKGARDATTKFADIYMRNKDTGTRADYEAFLDDLEQNFGAKNEKLLLDDRSDMNIEIEVLRDRLQREGVTLD